MHVMRVMGHRLVGVVVRPQLLRADSRPPSSDADVGQTQTVEAHVKNTVGRCATYRAQQPHEKTIPHLFSWFE